MPCTYKNPVKASQQCEAFLYVNWQIVVCNTNSQWLCPVV